MSRRRIAKTASTMLASIAEPKNRAFFAVISAPPVSSVRRNAPARTGMRLSTISPAGTSHWCWACVLRGRERLLLSTVVGWVVGIVVSF